MWLRWTQWRAVAAGVAGDGPVAAAANVAVYVGLTVNDAVAVSITLALDITSDGAGSVVGADACAIVVAAAAVGAAASTVTDAVVDA